MDQLGVSDGGGEPQDPDGSSLSSSSPYWWYSRHYCWSKKLHEQTRRWRWRVSLRLDLPPSRLDVKEQKVVLRSYASMVFLMVVILVVVWRAASLPKIAACRAYIYSKPDIDLQ
jgi:hypothetical protein